MITPIELAKMDYVCQENVEKLALLGKRSIPSQELAAMAAVNLQLTGCAAKRQKTGKEDAAVANSTMQVSEIAQNYDVDESDDDDNSADAEGRRQRR